MKFKSSYQFSPSLSDLPKMGDQPEEKKKSVGKRALKLVKNRFPILAWLPKYSTGDLVADAIAGITVGLTVVPQSMAYAAIAGLSPEYGLYSSYIACLLYVVLGSCRQATIGPTAVMGLLTFQTCGNDYAECAVLAGFYSGVIELCMACLQLGWVVSFISEPVTIGFTAAASITIISSQVKSFFGIGGPKGSGFIGYWTAVFRDISSIHLSDSIVGVACFICLYGLMNLKDIKLSKPSAFVKKALWLISVSRNVIIVITTTIIACIWAEPPFKLVGKVQAGFPEVALPQFELPAKHFNETVPDLDETLSFGDSWKVLGSGPLVLALISVLQNVAISKAFGAGQKVDATQEMFALGICNILGSFVSAIPTSGSFSRSAVNAASGVRSPLGGLFTGVLVLLALSFLTPSFYFIPKASLAAVIISAVMQMVEYQAIMPMLRISKFDVVTCLTTFATALIVGMEYGIIIGVALSIGGLLYTSLKPNINQRSKHADEVKYFIITPESGLTFTSVDFIRTNITKLALKNKNVTTYFLNFEKWNQFDYTAATALTSMVKVFEKDGKCLAFTNCSPEFAAMLQEAGLSNPPVVVWTEIENYVKKAGSVIINLPTDINVGIANDPNGSIQTDFSSCTTLSGTRNLINTG